MAHQVAIGLILIPRELRKEPQLAAVHSYLVSSTASKAQPVATARNPATSIPV